MKNDAALSLLARIEADIAALRAMHQAPCLEPEPVEMPEAWLAPCQIADRLGLGERYVRRLLARALRDGHEGVRKPAGRWQATMAAVNDLRAV